MVQTLSSQSAGRLRDCFGEAGYSEPSLKKALGAPELPSIELRNHARLLDRTSEPTLLNLLIRLFWIGVPQDRGLITAVVPAEFLSLLLESGLLELDGEKVRPGAMLLPAFEFLVASDHPSAFHRQVSDLVLWPNPTSKFLSRFAVRRRSQATLDLGTGCGILSLVASSYSDVVVATDLNDRAADFARFNAWLNGVENIEILTGDCFEPVTGRRFDLILANPPFFITPQADYLFCDNPMDLDALCRRLVKEAPKYLNEDGYMEMLCEWAEIKGQPWEERVAEWLTDSGCDSWVMKGLTQNPEEYAQHRIRETSPDATLDASRYAEYMEYYRRRGVEAIHDGLIVMRRRDGQNFTRIEQVPTSPSGDLGELVLSTFAAHDLLRENEANEQLLAVHPVLSPHARLEQIFVPGEGGWITESLTLRLKSGFPFHIDVQPLVAQFLTTCDGTRTAREVIEDLARKLNTSQDAVEAECLKMIRQLVERGFMVASEMRDSASSSKQEVTAPVPS